MTNSERMKDARFLWILINICHANYPAIANEQDAYSDPETY